MLVAAPHATAQLVELGQTEPVGAVDDDRVGAGDVQAVLDDRRGHQHIGLVLGEAQHDLFQLALAHLPVGGDHQARQKYREGQFVIPVSEGRKASVIISTLRRPDKRRDRYYHLDSDHMPLIRLEEETNYGLMTYELTTINGELAGASELFQ